MADSEKSLGRKILGFFVREEAEPKSRTDSKPSKTTAKAPPMVVRTVQETPIVDTPKTAEVDPKFVEHFAELLEKANLPGPDYFEFKQALKSMDGLGLSEEKQFQASWGSFKAMGGVSDTAILTTSAGQYGEVLNRDRASFLKDVEAAINDRIGSLNQESKKLEENNTSYAQQIVDLQKKIDANNDRLEKINGEMQEQTEKINTSRDSFEITYRSIVDQINDDVEKIGRYLK